MVKKTAIFLAGAALGAYAMYNHLVKKIANVIISKRADEANEAKAED